jgi:hypothetical protein
MEPLKEKRRSPVRLMGRRQFFRSIRVSIAEAIILLIRVAIAAPSAPSPSMKIKKPFPIMLVQFTSRAIPMGTLLFPAARNKAAQAV